MTKSATNSSNPDKRPWTDTNSDKKCRPDQANIFQRWMYRTDLHNGAYMLNDCEKWSLYAFFWICVYLVGMYLYAFSAGFWHGLMHPQEDEVTVLDPLVHSTMEGEF
ncbi:hypothetical protein FisN_15Hh032 [Fistulifera solaris]|uniref:Uncharacterized protein n=1 Tax=Fistulifera solaris TaxID=1519565 RepID=A0A1Z5KAV1_FISSO|nr:hypothetical protein FisN_15Hh032 [Fistulifera solaris]|eukprot:GAX23068.1 hypothetical protein FisN_15Hh032 [Fistulifera solaris]